MLMRVALLCGIALRVAAAGAPPRALVDYVTYLGGAYADTVAGIAVDSTGSAYIAGNTVSPNFPVTSTALGTPTAASNCAFVTKFASSGAAIEFSVCLADSQATAFALDARGNMYLSVAVNQLSYKVVKLDPSGQSILYTTTIGAAAEAMTVDAAGDVYVAGAAGPGLATTFGAYQAGYPGGQCQGGHATEITPCTNAFVTKLAPSGSVAWTTYLGGSGPDNAHAIALDSAGNAWVAGHPNFPTTAGAFARTFHGALYLGPLVFGDAFAAELDPNGSRLLYSTYLGGSGADAAWGIAVDAAGAAYVAGITQSADFPTTPGGFQTAYSGYNPNQEPGFGDAFVTKFETNGQLTYSTFIGLSSGPLAPIAVDATGQAYVGASSIASSTSIQPTCATPANTAVFVLNSTGSAVVATSPIPGAYLALDGKGALYSAGLAYTLVFFSTPHAFQTIYGGGDSDAFAAKVDFSQPAGPSLASVLNAASLFPGYASPYPAGAVAPGEIVTLFGNGFGSKPSVSFGPYPAPILFASNCQINAVVPFEVTPSLPTFATVQSGGQTLGPLELPVVASVPGIFTWNASGTGQAAILNQDFTVNSASNPAPRGSIVAVYMTGAGSLNPPMADGSLGPLSAPYPEPIASITATIGSVGAAILFAGQAPALIAGATQVNIQIPGNAPVGAAIPIAIYAGYYASPFAESVTMAVR